VRVGLAVTAGTCLWGVCRKELKKKEMDELEALLADFGLQGADGQSTPAGAPATETAGKGS
jgi:hypothetical protein